MKIFLLTSCLLLFGILNIQSQTFSLLEVDKAPVIGDCEVINGDKKCFEESLRVHVQNTMDIMKLNLGKNAKAYVQFEITKEGKIGNVRVRTTDDKLLNESKRIIEKLKIIEPAKKDGNSVALLHTIPVTFSNLSLDSYDELFEKEKDFANGFGPSHTIKDVAQPPVFKICLSSADKIECFKNSLEEKIKSFVISDTTLNDLNNKGDNIKIYFEVGADSKLKNPIVIYSNKQVRLALTNFLSRLEFERSAFNKQDQPVEVFYQENLIF